MQNCSLLRLLAASSSGGAHVSEYWMSSLAGLAISAAKVVAGKETPFVAEALPVSISELPSVSEYLSHAHALHRISAYSSSASQLLWIQRPSIQHPWQSQGNVRNLGTGKFIATNVDLRYDIGCVGREGLTLVGGELPVQIECQSILVFNLKNHASSSIPCNLVWRECTCLVVAQTSYGV